MGETLSIKTGDGQFQAYVARPGAAPAATLVVIQEIFGVNAVMRGIADTYAAQGFLAICPDLFWRIEPGIDITDKSEAEWKRAFELFNAFDVNKGVADIAATIDAIRQDPGSNGKVGTVGYCLGGLLAFLSATRTNTDASVGYYGVGIDGRLAELASLRSPLMLHIAEEDGFVSKEAQAAIKAAVAGDARVTVHSYAGQDHAFARDGGEHYDAASAELANSRTYAFFREHLK